MQERECCDSSLLLARKYHEEGKLARSFAHYLVHWHLAKISPSASGCDLSEVLHVFEKLISKLESDNRTEDLLSTFQQFMEVLPHSDNTSFRFAKALFKNGSNVKAMAVLKKCSSLKCLDLLDTVKSYSLERWHFPMLNDKARNLAFFQALQQVVKPEDMVLDVGTGTGLLALFAAKANAKKVVACEASEEMSEIAQIVFSENKMDQKIDLHKALSTQLNLTGLKGNVLVTETFDAGLLGEHVLEIVDHAWKYLLGPKATVVPGKARVYCCLASCESVKLRNRVVIQEFCSINFNGLSISSTEMKTDPYDSQRVARSRMVSDASMLVEINFNDKQQVENYLSESTILKQSLVVTKNSEIDCVVLWFQLVLDPSSIVTIGTSPEDKSCWEQAVFPLTGIINAIAGDVINVEINLKGHFTLKSVEKMGSSSLNGLNVKTELTLPRDSIRFINLAKPIVVNASERILDFTEIPLISLTLLKSYPNCKLTMLNISKEKIDFVSEMASSNGIDLSRIDGISQLDQDSYDVAIFDPVQLSGRLNPSSLMTLKGCRNVSRFQPSKMSLQMALVQSEELVRCFKVPSDSSVLDFKIAQFVNTLSINHVQNIRLEELNYEFLSDPLNVHDFVFSPELGNEKSELEVSVSKAGVVHAVIYWFDLHYDGNEQICTIKDKTFDVAAILLKEPIQVDIESILTCEFSYEDGLLDLQVSSE